MSKQKSKVPIKSKSSSLANFQINKIIPEKYHNIAAIIFIIVLFIIIFWPLYFGGKTFESGDINTIKSMQSYIQKDRDGFSLWNPYIFCGLPAVATGLEFRWWDFIGAIYSYGKYLAGFLFSVDYAVHTINLLLIALTSFFFMRSRKTNVLISLLVSVATTFSTGIILFVYVGHITKMISLASFPLILMMLLKFNDKIRLVDFVLMAAFMHFVVLGAHAQIIFYIFLAIAIYYLFYFGLAIFKKENVLRNNLIKSALLFVAASSIALLMSLDNYAQLWEYNQYSTRGSQSIIEKQSPAKAESDFYEYATNWSFSPEEILTFIVPSFYGFGNVTYNGELSNYQNVQANTYFGQMPFVDVAMYMGVIIFFLGILGIYLCWKDPFVKYLAVIIILFLIISFGRNLPILYNLFYYNFPYFNKFRVPSMILTIIQMSFPILAGLGLKRIVELSKEKDQRLFKVVKYTATAFGIGFILSILFNSAIANWFTSHIQSAGQKGTRLQQLYSFMADMFTGDLIINFALLTLTFGAIILFIRKKLSADLLICTIIFFILVDLIRIDLRGSNYQEEINTASVFNMPEYIKTVKEQKDPEPYRIINLKKEGFGTVSQNSNFNVYFLEQDFYGYSSVKPRTYQDIVEIVGPVNPNLWRMLNVKYIAVDSEIDLPGAEVILKTEGTVVYKNYLALPRAYFVDSVATKPMLDVLNMIKNNAFDPKKVAFLEDKQITIDKPDSSAFVKITKYDESLIKLEVNATGNNFLFFGDTYYPNGWKAFIDERETEILRTNHGFRGIVVPNGKHKIEFKYEPASFYLGKNVSLLLNIFLIAAFVVVFVKRGKESSVSINQ